MPTASGSGRTDAAMIRGLSCVMFLMFAMTSDAVGSVIPQVIAEFRLSLTAAGALHYAPMLALAAGALLLGFLADRLGRKPTIIAGLILYGASSLVLALSSGFAALVALLALAGLGISVFKIGALALIGDISRSTTEHTRTMNLLEGFFGVGAILGPAIVAVLVSQGMPWRWLYGAAAGVCGLLVLAALAVRYPPAAARGPETVGLARSLRMATDTHALGFSLLVMLYVACEVAIYVWMPTYLESYAGDFAWLPVYALTIFFVLRAAGRFLGYFLIGRYRWTTVLAVFGLAILLCFAGSLAGGVEAGALLLPASGLFMSVMYPTLNSKGISCFPGKDHGAVAGLILFFTALAAALGPLAMAAVSDAFGGPQYGFALATGFAALLAAGLLVNWMRDPAGARLRALDAQRQPA